MTTIKNLLEEAADKIRDALYLIDQGYHLEANIDAYTVPVTDVKDEIFESFSDFKACVISAFPDTVEKGEFIDASKAFAEEDPKRCVYYWGSKYGADFVEYDTGTVKNFRWTIYHQYRRGFGATFGEAIQNYTRQFSTMLNHGKDCSKEVFSEDFSDFQACVISAFPDTVEKGEFIDDSEAYVGDEPKRQVYYWASLPKYGADFVEYDSGAVKNFRWTIYQQYRRGFGATFGEAIQNYTRQFSTMLNHRN